MRVYDLLEASVSIATDGTTGEVTLKSLATWDFGEGKQCELLAVHLTIPNYTNTVATTFNLQDAADHVFYTKAALTQNGIHALPDAVVNPKLMIEGGSKMQITLAGVPGGSVASVVSARIFLKRNRY